MNIDRDDIIEYLEKLILIKFTDDERKKIEKEIEKIIEMFDMLNSVENIEHWEPLYHVHDISLLLREDEEIENVDYEHTTIKRNAVIVDGYVKAPKTVSE